jgi:hypothetical protein
LKINNDDDCVIPGGESATSVETTTEDGSKTGNANKEIKKYIIIGITRF